MEEAGEQEQQRVAPGKILWFVVPLLASAIIILVEWFLWLGNRAVTEENHSLENLQLAFLILAVGFHLKQGFRVGATPLRICHLVLALLCFSVFLREFDIDKIGAEEIWGTIETIIRSIAGLAWIYIFYLVVRNLQALWDLRLKILLSVNSLLVATAIAFYLASWFFDKELVPVPLDVSKFIEESVQLTGTVFFFASSLRPIFLPQTKA
jgi:uncharacterized membrane protein